MTWATVLRRNLFQHPGRTVVAGLSVVIGVAIFVGVSEGTRSVTRAIERLYPTGDVAGIGSAGFDDDAVAFFRSIEDSLAPLAASALLIGGFLIHLTLSRTVRDRQRVHGCMRAMGASRRGVVALVLAEAVIVGAVGAALGIGVGLVLGDAIGTAMAEVFGVPLAAGGSASFPVATIAVAFAAGVGTAALAAVVPARRAARADPATSMRPSAPAAVPRGPRAVLGVVLILTGAWATSRVGEAVTAATGAVAMLGVLLVAPTAVAPAARALRRLAGPRLRDAGELATAELARSGSRAPAAAGILAATLTLVVVVATIIASQRPVFIDAIEENLGADAVGFATTSVPGRAAVSDDTIALLRSSGVVRGVAPVGTSQVAVVEPEGQVEQLTVVDPASYLAVSGFAWTLGTDGEDAVRALEAGGVLIASEIATDLGLGVGDAITLGTTSGPAARPIAGIYYGFAYGETNAIVVTEDMARRDFGYVGPNRLLVDLVDPTALPFTAELAWASQAQLREDILAQYDGVWGLVQVILVLTALTGLLGLANAMVMEVLDRGHQLGVLRAIGMHRGSLRRLVALEALVVAVVAGAVAVVAGTALGRALVSDSTAGIDLSVEPRFPVSVVPLVLVMAALVGAVAAVVPARRAARLDPAEAIRVGLGD